ncbi:hypothetical protein IWW50_003636 [Coemansia erecta]|nr:hypothetical protein GGF43_002991 [Coemansia sp. RSA 2618]KAJ2823762.1 hypothetical protein IWW50_003636 [Coemansia erecta]
MRSSIRRLTTDDSPDSYTPPATESDPEPNSEPNPEPKPKTNTKPKTPAPTKKPITLHLSDIDEKHVRGWGNGGQKLNKTSSCVQLTHRPTGTQVTCQDTRSLQQNRKIAMKRLKEKLDLQINGSVSKIGQKIEKLRARKHKQRQRAKKKYQGIEKAKNDDDL